MKWIAFPLLMIWGITLLFMIGVFCSALIIKCVQLLGLM